MRLRLGLGAGVAAAVITIPALVLGGARWPGYDPLTQTVSQLVAHGAPTRGPLTAVFAVYNGLLLGFGLALAGAAGVVRSARPGWGRAAGRRVVALALLGWLLLLLPVDRPGVARSATGVAHAVVAGGMAVLAVAVALQGGRWLRAAGLGGHGRLSRLMAGLMAACAVWTFVALQRGGPAGLAERLLIGCYELWMAVVALRLARALTTEH